MCTSPYILKNSDNLADKYVGMEVPCRHCLQCRMQRSSQWQLRLDNELTAWDSAIFVTLTYDNDTISTKHKGMSLEKKDLVNFTKRLKYFLNKKNRKIKYYGCGEYGERNKRPHYHIIIFGMSLSELQLERHPRSGYWCRGGILNDSWDKGLIHVGTCTQDSISYVASYTTKKTTHTMQQKYELEQKGFEPEFQITSQGMGLSYALKNVQQIEKFKYLLTRHGKKVPIPKYYWKKLDEMQVLCYNDVRNELEENAKETQRKRLQIYNEISKSNLSETNLLDYKIKSNQYLVVNETSDINKMYYTMVQKINRTIFAYQQQQNLHMRAKFLRQKEFHKDDF